MTAARPPSSLANTAPPPLLHLSTARSLCGYTHPIMDVAAPSFTALADMKRHIESTYKLSFCDICAASRKVRGRCWGQQEGERNVLAPAGR